MLLSQSGDLERADEEIASLLSETTIGEIVRTLPDELLSSPAIAADFPDAESARRRYADYVVTRLRAPRAFLDEAVLARQRADRIPPRRVMSRR